MGHYTSWTYSTYWGGLLLSKQSGIEKESGQTANDSDTLGADNIGQAI